MPNGLSPRLFSAIVSLFVAFVGSGCVNEALWESADATTISFDRVGPVVDMQSNGTKGRALTVGYGINIETGLLNIPLELDGSPKPPFAYLGHVAKGEPVWSEVSDGQRADILKNSTLEQGHAIDVLPFWDPNYSDPNSPARSWTARTFEINRGEDRLVAIAYGIDSHGKPVPLQDFPSGPKFSGSLQFSKTQIALVPFECLRVPEVRKASRTTAVILTPFAVAIDLAIYAVIVPIGLPIQLIATR
jgi:hypothetical protein